MKYDFHFHSTFSDGSERIETIFGTAKKQGLTALALADHDTVLGIPTAAMCAKKLDICYIPAAEFTAKEQGMRFHVLGYGIDDTNSEMINYSHELLNCMNERSKRQIEKMQNNGIDIPQEAFFERGGGGPLYRAKLLGVLADFGYIDRNRIMSLLPEYFGKGMPYYEEDTFAYRSFEQICDMIHRAGGKAVLAHPEKIKKKNEELYYALLSSSQLDGLEVYHPQNSFATQTELLGVADRRKLIYTGGTDFHGAYMKQPLQVGEVEVPDACFDFLKDLRVK